MSSGDEHMPPRLLFEPYEGEPQATIKRIGRWTYWVSVRWGLIGMGEHGGWRKWGRRSAEASARRAIRQWKAEVDAETWTVTD